MTNANANVLDFSKWQKSREKISEHRNFEKYIQLLSLQGLMNESSTLIAKLQDGELDEPLMIRCKMVLKEINERMGEQANDLNRAFERLFRQAYQRIGELNDYLEVEVK